MEIVGVMATGVIWAGCLLGGLWVAGRRAGAGPAGGLSLRAYPMVLVVVALTLPVVLVARVETGDGGTGSGPDPVQVAVLVGAVALVGGGLFALGLNLAGHDPGADRIARRLVADGPSQQLLTRWLQRVRWRRWLGGFLGVVLGLLTLDNGTGWDRLVILGLAGVVAGSVSAELHHLRPERGDRARVVELAPRHFADYTVRAEEAALATVAVVALGLIGADRVTSGDGGGWWSAAALAAVTLAGALQWRIVRRRRPALPAELRQADDLLRRLSVSRGVARPTLALSLALLGQALGAAGVGVLAAGCWLAAVATWWLGRRLGLDHLLRRPVAVA